jgi:glycosyltransferase involved in cell wall biosynthesis
MKLVLQFTGSYNTASGGVEVCNENALVPSPEHGQFAYCISLLWNHCFYFEVESYLPMNVLIAVVSSTIQLSGVSRHAANLARCLLTRNDIKAVHLVVAEWQYESICGVVPHEDARLHIHTVSIGRGTIERNLWYYWKLPALAALLEVDIVHLAYPSPLKRHAYHCPTVVTLHDLYPYDIPGNFGFPKVFFNRLILQQCLHAAAAIACISESTLRQLKRYTTASVVQKAATISNCVEVGPPIAGKSPLPSWNGEQFLLCVAQHRRNKNILVALRVFHRLLHNGEVDRASLFVLIGIEGPETARIHRFIEASGLSGHVVLLHGVSDAELQWCYKHAELLLAPSIIEGFGLPVAEAMLHRCRVVCSDIPAFREVGGSYCHYADLQPSPEDAFVHAIRLARKDLKFRPADTDRFSAPGIADAYLELYHGLRKRSFGAASRKLINAVSSPEGKGHFERLK